MIKARLTQDDGTTAIILGLSEENVRQLKAGKPIMFDADIFGVDGNVYITYGETEERICRDLNLPVPKHPAS
jgi:hypothetical protein